MQSEFVLFYYAAARVFLLDDPFSALLPVLFASTPQYRVPPTPTSRHFAPCITTTRYFLPSTTEKGNPGAHLGTIPADHPGANPGDHPGANPGVHHQVG